MFAGTKVHHLNVTSSDHKALWISLEHMHCSFQKPFRFEQMWLTDKGCSDTVEAVWRINCNESWDSHVLRKIESCGAALSKWSKKSFGSVKKQLESARKRLKAAENHAIRSGDSSRMRLLEERLISFLIRKPKCGGSGPKLHGFMMVIVILGFSIAKPLNAVGGTILPSCMMLIEDGAPAKLKLMPPL